MNLAALLFFASAAPSPYPSDFVYLHDVAPTVIQDIRYAGANNFTGAPVPGYDAPECVLTLAAATALASVQSELEAENLSLIVWDCYRPARAVAAFMAWTKDGPDTMKGVFYPNVERDRLVELGYIAARSGHSAGSVVDLGIAPLGYHPSPSGQVSCIGPQGDGLPDMGTAFDCFDPQSAWDATVPDDVEINRERLKGAMLRHGFVPYTQEWWHFRLANEPYAGLIFDAPIAPRAGTP